MPKPRPFNNCKFCNYYFCKSLDRQNICSITCAFLSRVVKEQPNDCWPWKGSTNDAGYGEFSFLGKMYRAHRFSLEYHNNIKLLDDESALHTCDNPICCNPNHLYKGNAADNINDAYKRGRKKRQLQEAQVIKIKHLLKEGKSKNSIAKEFNVSFTTIYHIDKGNFWTHVIV